ncbi:MAG: response regulator [candidate division Zixibacteria bacterium]|nr:response regulator [candidate division Zixibacteria bacterium]
MNNNCEKKRKNILIIEDDKEIADLLKLHLKDINYETYHCNNGQDGLDIALGEEYDLVILDLMLPDLDGLDICRRLREQKRYIPVLMLTSKAEEMDRVLGLELGADDYLTKPFSIRELIARVKAIFRRTDALSEIAAEDEKEKLSFDNLELDLGKRKVTLGDQSIELTSKEFDLLKLFARHPGRAYSREDLLTNIWGYQFSGYDHTVNSHINRLRSKIENDPANPRFIKTVWGFGYRFAEREEIER